MKRFISVLVAASLAASLAVSAFAYEASEWAKPYVESAEKLGLLPDMLAEEDLSDEITRLEFASVAVLLYEALTEKEFAPEDAGNVFSDCDDENVIKAYSLGITNGVTETEFAPDRKIKREELATMLTRVWKKYLFPEWSITAEEYDSSQYTMFYETHAPYFDDMGKISFYAYSPIMFMRARGIIDGMGENKFVPDGTASREQALKIAERMVKVIKNKNYAPMNANLIDSISGNLIYSWVNDENDCIIRLYGPETELKTQYKIHAPSEDAARWYAALGTKSKGEASAWYYSAAGLFRFEDGELTRVSERSVKDMAFVRAGAEGVGPMVLLADPKEPGRDGDTIISLAGGSEEVLLSHEDGHGIEISRIEGGDGCLRFFSETPVGMMHYDIYTYELHGTENGPSIIVCDFEAGRPEVMDGFTYESPDDYKEQYINKEQERLNALGLGIK